MAVTQTLAMVERKYGETERIAQNMIGLICLERAQKFARASTAFLPLTNTAALRRKVVIDGLVLMWPLAIDLKAIACVQALPEVIPEE